MSPRQNAIDGTKPGLIVATCHTSEEAVSLRVITGTADIEKSGMGRWLT